MATYLVGQESVDFFCTVCIGLCHLTLGYTCMAFFTAAVILVSFHIVFCCVCVTVTTPCSVIGRPSALTTYDNTTTTISICLCLSNTKYQLTEWVAYHEWHPTHRITINTSHATRKTILQCVLSPFCRKNFDFQEHVIRTVCSSS